MYIAHTPLNAYLQAYEYRDLTTLKNQIKKFSPQRHFFIGTHLGHVGIAMHAR